mmetsp:Transcript_36943/g.68169  ORF Transcript_36943/g.68169 Transcript_36943/m.68169 type:complete len:82 (+) Transcript_36943:304-549(+)
MHRCDSGKHAEMSISIVRLHLDGQLSKLAKGETGRAKLQAASCDAAAAACELSSRVLRLARIGHISISMSCFVAAGFELKS